MKKVFLALFFSGFGAVCLAVVPTGTVGGRLYNDINGDGKQSGTAETGVASVRVRVTDVNGVQQTCITDANGVWTATPVPAGNTIVDVRHYDNGDPFPPADGSLVQTQGTNPTTVKVVAKKTVTVANGYAPLAVPMTEKYVVLKGTAAYTANYVHVPNAVAPATPDLNEALELQKVAALKPSLLFFLVCDVSFTPVMVQDAKTKKLKWTGDGDLEIWPFGSVEYGMGRHHTTTLVWNPKTAYSYNMGDVFYLTTDLWPAKLTRVGDSWWVGEDPLGFNSITSDDGYALTKFTASLVAEKDANKKPTGNYWYTPTISSIEIAANLSQTSTGGTLLQLGTVKVKFVTDTKLTAIANDPAKTMADVGAAINAVLKAGKYPEIPALTFEAP